MPVTILPRCPVRCGGALFHGERNSRGASLSSEQIASWKVFRSLAIVAGESAQGHVPVNEIFNLIEALCGMEDAQAAMLQRVESDVRLIREDVLKIRNDVNLMRTEPFLSAREHLNTAIRNVSDGTQRAHHLQQAQDLLIRALNLCASPEESSVVHFNLGVIAAARGQQNEARYQMKQAYETGVEVVEELSHRSSDVYWPPDAKTRAAVEELLILRKALGVGDGLIHNAPHHILSMFRGSDPKAIGILKAYIPFVDAVARAYNAIEPTAVALSPQLCDIFRGEGYTLEWIRASVAYGRPDGPA
jgi:hypothetical protein